jgi:hypothetical protein
MTSMKNTIEMKRFDSIDWDETEEDLLIHIIMKKLDLTIPNRKYGNEQCFRKMNFFKDNVMLGAMNYYGVRKYSLSKYANTCKENELLEYDEIPDDDSLEICQINLIEDIKNYFVENIDEFFDMKNMMSCIDENLSDYLERRDWLHSAFESQSYKELQIMKKCKE